MAYATVDVDLHDLDDDDLVDELESRGFVVVESDDDDNDPLLSEIFWRYRRGDIEDAMILLERRFPELHGISRKIKV